MVSNFQNELRALLDELFSGLDFTEDDKKKATSDVGSLVIKNFFLKLTLGLSDEQQKDLDDKFANTNSSHDEKMKILEGVFDAQYKTEDIEAKFKESTREILGGYIDSIREKANEKQLVSLEACKARLEATF